MTTQTDLAITYKKEGNHLIASIPGCTISIINPETFWECAEGEIGKGAAPLLMLPLVSGCTKENNMEVIHEFTPLYCRELEDDINVETFQSLIVCLLNELTNCWVHQSFFFSTDLATAMRLYREFIEVPDNLTMRTLPTGDVLISAVDNVTQFSAQLILRPTKNIIINPNKLVEVGEFYGRVTDPVFNGFIIPGEYFLIGVLSSIYMSNVSFLFDEDQAIDRFNLILMLGKKTAAALSLSLDEEVTDHHNPIGN